MTPEVEGTTSEVTTETASSATESAGAATESAATESADGAASTETPVIAGDAADQAAAAAAAANQYTPDYKFRAGDKDHEIPEKMRGFIKNAEDEKELKSLYSKAFGLDANQATVTKWKTEIEAMRPEIGRWRSGAQELAEDYKRGDFDSFFKKLNVPEEKILQWVWDKVQYNQLSTEQRAQIDRQKNAERSAFEATRYNDTLQTQMVDMARQAKNTQLEFCMSKPEVQSVAEAFDSRVGKPGSFREAVRSHGEAVWLRSQGKIDLTPQQAFDEVVKLYGIQATAAAKTQATTIPAGTQSAKPKVIPNISGRSSASPLKAGPKSIEDLKKIREEKYGSNAG